MAGAATTPPPTSRIRIPPTPRLGLEDDYQPYARRKSTRVASQLERSAQTPPPASNHNLRSSNSSPQSAAKRSVSGSSNITPPSTISRKRANKPKPLGDDLASSRRATSPQGFYSSIGTRNEMLPTPAKTPQKRAEAKTSTITSIARNLFPVRHETVEQAMPSPKRRGKKYKGFSLDGYGEDKDESIAIFTDSKERLPEADPSSDNPFYGPEVITADAPSKRGSKRRRVAPRESNGTEEEIQEGERKDGLVYVFRGKKIFRRFSDLDEAGSRPSAADEVEDEIDVTVPSRLRGPLTRSSMKPRLLFPTQRQLDERDSQYSEADEEADTDIEEGNALATPALHTDKVATPRAPRFAPVSPPSTVARTTRSKKVSSDDEMAGASFSSLGSASPFESWQRTKPKGQKRGSDAISAFDTGNHKRLRG
ncbi:hypothetical protein V496_03591 [Pseudogymnoascus sp. VKM F-4515 (FW-2607)]|nr:hypothetical protein V496_03591 [Pseudogymnoascus sp. VKM F-4515 (FW-2607)]KFY86612.1 hypothetical protein V498_07454 [Pseudogymnoascus sp. VKM F-4517 (FW-2822)]